MDDSGRPGYIVPTYRAPEDTAFFHFLHGTVPGHQIDFMYCPEVPQGALAQTHFGHLSRLMKYIEPRSSAAHAFAIGNLSRDDIQHEPGHGGVAVLFALRVPGVTDHAGRDMPPYAHGIVAVDRALDYLTLLEAISKLYRRFIDLEGALDRRGDFYRTYARAMQERPEEVQAFLDQAVMEHDELPRPGPSDLDFDFAAGQTPAPATIIIVHDDDEPFATIAQCAAFLGAALYRSDLKWTSITTGREIDIPGGTTVRFVPRSEAATAEGAARFELDDLPEDEDNLLGLLFGAVRRVEQSAPRRRGWREQLAAVKASSRPPEHLPAGLSGPAPVPAPARQPSVRPAAAPAPAPAWSPPVRPDTGFRVARDNRLRKGRWIIIAAVIAAVVVVVVLTLTALLSGAPGAPPPPPGSSPAAGNPPYSSGPHRMTSFA